MNRALHVCAVSLVVVLACKEKPAEAPSKPAAEAPAAPVAAPAKAPAAPGSPEVGGPAVVTRVISVRLKASDDKTLPATEPGKKATPNWLATLRRGERLTVSAIDGDWLKVKLSDDREGYVKSKSVLGGAVEEATVLDEKSVYDRPDPVAIRAGKKIAVGSLLLVYRNKDAFSQVNLADGSDGWVRDADLERGSPEIGVARMLVQVNELKAAKKTNEADELMKTAQQTFAGAKLLARLEGGTGASPETPPTEEQGE